MEAANELFPFFQGPPGRAGSLTRHMSFFLNKVDILLGHWWKLTRGSVNRKIFGAATIVAILTLVTQLASVAKELTVATSIKFLIY